MNNIFSTLYKYKPQPGMTPEENFFTESFKFILQLDSSLCTRFVKLISNGEKFTAPFVVSGQAKYGSSIIDLEIKDKNSKKIWVEIKLRASENVYNDGEEEDADYGQIEKYLRLNKAYVCFIAQEESDVDIKTNKNKYLGQLEWFQVYEVINEYYKKAKLTELKKYFISNFLKFMKDRNMQIFEGFTKHDIEISQTNFFEFYDKLLDFLNFVKKDKRVIDFCKRNKFSMDKPLFYTSWKGFVLKLKHDVHKKLVIRIGFNYYKYDLVYPEYPEGLYHFIDLCTFKSGLRSAIQEKHKKLKVSQKYFQDQYPWNNCILGNDLMFSDFIKNGEEKTVDFIVSQLEELENKNIIKTVEGFF